MPRKEGRPAPSLPILRQAMAIGLVLLQTAGRATSLSEGPPPRSMDRRRLLGTLVGVLAPSPPALAGIDVSGLTVQANPLDTFLGGTYYEDSPEGVDGRIGRRKYFILEPEDSLRLLPINNNNNKPKTKPADFFGGLEARPVIVRGESTAISSSRDDSLELQGILYLCTEPGKTGQGCITIDFSPLGGSPNTKGYWDANERGIRFIDTQVVWSKQ